PAPPRRPRAAGSWTTHSRVARPHPRLGRRPSGRSSRRAGGRDDACGTWSSWEAALRLRLGLRRHRRGLLGRLRRGRINRLLGLGLLARAAAAPAARARCAGAVPRAAATWAGLTAALARAAAADRAEALAILAPVAARL